MIVFNSYVIDLSNQFIMINGIKRLFTTYASILCSEFKYTRSMLIKGKVKLLNTVKYDK